MVRNQENGVHSSTSELQDAQIIFNNKTSQPEGQDHIVVKLYIELVSSFDVFLTLSKKG